MFANPDGVFTPGMFGRIRVPGSPPYEALLVPDAAIGTEQVRKFVLVVGDDNTAAAGTSRSARSSTTCASSRTGSRPTTASIVNGLMRVRPGVKVTPQEQGAPPGARRRRPD